MARNSFQNRLDALSGQVAAMGDRALEQYNDAVSVLESGDETAAETIIDNDAALNDWYLDIESECIELLALQQPVASDLRFVASSFKIATDLERIGDLATNLAEYGAESGGELPADLDIQSIATGAGEMVEAALDAYAKADAQRARSIAAMDETLDAQCKDASETVVRGLLQRENAPGTAIEPTLNTASSALLVIRDLERVGDHAVNICARTVYMVDHDDGLLY